MGKEGTALIVEDDVCSKKILINLFEDVFDIAEAENGKEALLQLQKTADDLVVIILDLLMPVMDGYELLKELAENKRWRDIPVVVTTAENSLESDQRLVDLGARHIIHKPINAGVVKKQVMNIAEVYQENKRLRKSYALQKTLINSATNTFLCTYRFKENRLVELGDNYRDFVDDDFPKMFESYPFNIKDFVMQKDYAIAKRFFSIGDGEATYEEIEIKFRIDKVHYEWFKIAAMVSRDEDDQLDNITFLFTNIEKDVEAKQALTFMAIHDRLTRIPNMRTFSGDVRAMLLENPDEDFLMITMDLYQFRMINKLFGYSEGDNVLKYFAMKLQEQIESYEKGIYCRMASDIFYACISEKEDVKDFIDELQDAMNNYPIKFDLKLCFGIYQIDDKEEEVEDMIEHSSYARSEVKGSPLKNVQYYNEHLKEKEYFETVVISEMETALKNRQFEVYLQPKCSIKAGEIIGAEALIRWNHPEKGFLPPGLFIPIFEQTGYIIELDHYIYEEVCKLLRKWLDQGLQPLPISVNVSRCDLYDAHLADHIFEIVDKYEIPHELIEFEITESAFVLEGALLTNFTSRLQEKGFRILIDDFGSGYSSLNTLKEISVDVLKIDIKFLPISIDEVKAPIILANIIKMAQELGLDIIAEGVEVKEQLELLKKLGCEKVQGYYFYRPMPIAEYEKCYEQKGAASYDK